jgi:hypothetical protein
MIRILSENIEMLDRRGAEKAAADAAQERWRSYR